jgi:hypothetical protein
MHTRVLVRAREWVGRSRDDSYLLRGADLKEALVWLTASGDRRGPVPSKLNSEYVQASQDAESRELAHHPALQPGPGAAARRAGARRRTPEAGDARAERAARRRVDRTAHESAGRPPGYGSRPDVASRVHPGAVVGELCRPSGLRAGDRLVRRGSRRTELWGRAVVGPHPGTGGRGPGRRHEGVDARPADPVEADRTSSPSRTRCGGLLGHAAEHGCLVFRVGRDGEVALRHESDGSVVDVRVGSGDSLLLVCSPAGSPCPAASSAASRRAGPSPSGAGDRTASCGPRGSASPARSPTRSGPGTWARSRVCRPGPSCRWPPVRHYPSWAVLWAASSGPKRRCSTDARTDRFGP